MLLHVALSALWLVGPSHASYRGSMTSYLSRKCWDVPNGDFSNGNIVWQWDCWGGDNQRWTFDNSDGTLKLSADLDKCLDVMNGDFWNGAQIQIWDCGGWPQQLVHYDALNNSIYFAGTGSDALKCVDVAGGGLDDGNPLIVWDCTNNLNQRFFYTPDSAPVPPPPPPAGLSHIISYDTGHCVDVQAIENGAHLWMWECNGQDQQTWVFSDGSITLGDGSKCVDVPNGDTANGNLVSLWDCSGLPQQMWEYNAMDAKSGVNGLIYLSQYQEGYIHWCMQMQDVSNLNGSLIEIWKCLPFGTQLFVVEAASTNTVVV